MRQKETPFLMAVTAAIIALFLVQIAAPTQFKPLTNHLLDYPGTLPAISFERGIYRSTTKTPSLSLPLINQAKLKILSYLPQTPQIAKVWVWGEAKAERESKQVKGGYKAQIVGNQAAAEAVYQQNLATKNGTTTTPAAPSTPTAVYDGACTQTTAYCAQYGNEVGRLGYVDPSSTDNVPAGFYRVADGTLRVLAIGATQTAYNQNAQVVAGQIGAIPKENLLQTFGTTNLDDAIKAYLVANSVIDADNQNSIIGNYKANQKLIEQAVVANEEVIKKLNVFLDPTASIMSLTGCNSPENCAEIDLKTYLKGLGLSDEEALKYAAERTTNVANYYKDLDLVQNYSDPLQTTSMLAAKSCGNDFGCVKNFNRADYLDQLTNKDFAESAKTNYQKQLINYTAMIGGDSFSKLPQSTQNSIRLTNSDITHALFVYLFESKATGNQFDVKALDFGNKIQDDPSILANYLGRYNDNKLTYDAAIDSTKVFNLTFDEANPVIIANIKNAQSTATIKGLSVNGETLTWSQTSDTYKHEARLLACQQDSSLKDICGHYKNAEKNHDIIAAQIDKKISSTQTYLDQL